MVEIADVENLSLIGTGEHQDTNKILCSSENKAGFSIQRFVNITFKKLSILNCSGQSEFDSILSNGTNLTITSTSVVNSTGYGVAAYQLQGHNSITDSLFSGNRASDNFPGGNALIYSTDCSGPTKTYRFFNASLHSIKASIFTPSF